MSDVVIQVENLCKEYRLGAVSHHTLARDLQSWWARVRHREDPNAQVECHPSSAPNRLPLPKDHFWALQDVSFDVKQGEVVGIVGRNGAGKSTLLKILSRVTAPTRGEVRYRGRIASLLEVGTGFHPELTGGENIYLNGAIHGMRRGEIDKKLDEIVAFAEVEKFLDTPVKRYSSGMYVRLAFAVAAHLEPEILIVDEVLAVGDASFRNKCLGKIGEVSHQGVTVLLVSHDMRAITRLCPRTILLAAGTVHRDGPTAGVVAEYLEWDRRDAAEVDLEPLPRAEGLGERLRLRKVALSGLSGRHSTSFLFGEPFTISLEAVSSARLEGVNVLIGIENFTGERIFTANSDDSELCFSLKSQEPLRIRAAFHDITLTPGVYWVTLGVRSGCAGLDQVVRGASFEVLSAPLAGKKPHSGTWGLIHVLPHWEKI